jgi:hypothetical protein
LGVFDAVKGEDKARLGADEDVFQGEELAFADDGYDSLVGSGLGHAGEGVPRFEAGFDAGFVAKVDELGEAMVLLAGTVAFARDAHIIEAAGPGAEGLFDGVQAVKVFH